MTLSLPPDDCMVPGQVYVGRLPGDLRPSFVRKRQPSTICDALGQVFTCRRRPSFSNRMMSWSHRRFYSPDFNYDYAPRRRRRCMRRSSSSGLVPANINHGRLATSIAQVCAACGKHRSPGWSSRHPLVPGEYPKPTLCKKCRAKDTSSEESQYSPKKCCNKKKKHKHYHGNCTSSEEEHYYSHGGHSHSYSHRHSHGPRRRLSRENINIFVENEPVVQQVRPIISEPSLSEEDIHVVRKTPPHKKSRSIVIEDLEERIPRRKISQNSIRIVRSRSPKPARYGDEYDMHPRRHRQRSSSHVSFVDEPEEIHMSRSKTTHRRPRIYYDGANSGESEANPWTTDSVADNADPTSKMSSTNAVIAAPKTTIPDLESSHQSSLLSFKEHLVKQGSSLSSSVFDALNQAHEKEDAPLDTCQKNTSHLEEDDHSGERHRLRNPCHRQQASHERPSKRQRQRTISADHVDDLTWGVANTHISPRKNSSSSPAQTYFESSSSATSPLTPIFDYDAYQYGAVYQPASTSSWHGYVEEEADEKHSFDSADFWKAKSAQYTQQKYNPAYNVAYNYTKPDERLDKSEQEYWRNRGLECLTKEYYSQEQREWSDNAYAYEDTIF